MVRFTVLLEIPALDRLVQFLEAAEQRHVDAATARIQQLTQRLQTSRTALESQITKEKS